MWNPNRAHPGVVVSRLRCSKCHGRVATTDVVCECGAILLPEGERKRLSGPRGWLGLFCFATIVGGPSVTAAALLSIVGSAGAAVFSTRVIGMVLLMVAPAIYGLFAGNALMRLRPAGVYHAKLYLLFNVVTTLGIIVVADVTHGAENAGTTAGELVRPLIYAAAWAVYFGNSRRVLVTYGIEATRRRIAPRHAISMVAPVVLIIIGSVWSASADKVSPTGDWVRYSPANSGMAVYFPRQPKEESGPVSTDAGSATLYSAHVGSGSTAFSIGYYDLPRAFADADATQALETIRDTTVKSTSGTLVDSRPVVVADVPGFEFRTNTATMATRGRIFLRGRRVIILMSVTAIRPSASDIEVSERFLMSFRPL
jgi:hypothetical protein